MSATINIVETTTELGVEVVEVTVTDASAPGPAGPGVPTGGTDGQVLTKTSGVDYATAWEDPTGGGGGAPVDATYLVTTADGTLTNEVAVGATPGGELGGTWASPTVDASHSGSTHVAVQAAAEATAAAALSAHEADTTSVHGIADTSVLATDSEVATAVSDHSADTTSVHGIADTSALALTANHPTNATFNDHSARHENGGADEISLAGLDGTPTDLQTHLDDAIAAHAGSAISVDSTTLSGTGTTVQASLEELDNLLDDHSARHENGGADEISLAGLDGIPTELQTHLDDTTAHLASRIPFTPAGTIAATDVQAAIEEVASEAGGGVPDLQYESRASNTILGTADQGKTIDITATITQTFEADETLGDGWWVILRNASDDGTTLVTLNPAGTETIDGLTTVAMYSGEARLIFCNGAGANFNSVLLHGGFSRFTSDGDFIVPHGITAATVECIGGGGGGGGGRGGAAGSTRNGGGGGGGGARHRVEVLADALGAPGSTIAVDVAVGGTSGGGGSSADGSDGGVGGTTTFGSLVSAFGGGGGFKGTSGAQNHTGGGGGGVGQAGAVSTGAGVATRGGGNMDPIATAAGGVVGTGVGMGGAGGGASGNQQPFLSYGAEWGGAAGASTFGSGAGNGASGASSLHGGGGGGAGGTLGTGNTERTGGAGGQSGVYGNSSGGGGAAGAVDGGAGTQGDDGDLRICGDGGGGGGSQASGTGGAGANGGAPGGGAGGGGGGTSVGGAGGVGGAGECRVWYS